MNPFEKPLWTIASRNIRAGLANYPDYEEKEYVRDVKIMMKIDQLMLDFDQKYKRMYKNKSFKYDIEARHPRLAGVLENIFIHTTVEDIIWEEDLGDGQIEIYHSTEDDIEVFRSYQSSIEQEDELIEIMTYIRDLVDEIGLDPDEESPFLVYASDRFNVNTHFNFRIEDIDEYIR